MNEVEKMLAIKARNAAIVGGSNLGQDKPMLYEDQIPKVATNAEILAAIRARHAAAMRGEKVEDQTTEQEIVAKVGSDLLARHPLFTDAPLAAITSSLDSTIEQEIQAMGLWPKGLPHLQDET